MRLQLCVCALAAALAAQAPAFTHCITNEQMRHFQTISDPQLSPDGEEVVYVQRESTADGAASHLWLAPSSGSAPPRQLTYSPESDHAGESSPAWMRDGSAILFLARRGEQRQIFRLPLSGGEPSPLAIETGDHQLLAIQGFEISPDGQWLAVRAQQPQTAAQKKDVKDKKDGVLVNEDPRQDRVWLFSFASARTLPVTPAERTASGMAWSEDSTQLAVITAPPGDSDDLGPKHEVGIVSTAAPENMRVVAGAPATVSSLAFSPSGQELALLAQSPHDAPPGISAVFLLPSSGGEARALSAASAIEIGRGLRWASPDAILVEGQRQTAGSLVRFSSDGGAPQWIDTGAAMAAGFATNLKQTGWAYIAQSTGRMPQVVYAAKLGDAPATLSRANANWPSTGWATGADVSWNGPGGLAIHGLYFAPRTSSCSGASAPAAGKSPLIVVVHGGPTGAFLQTYSPFVQWLTAQGWAVLEPNPRGSTGYGWQFAAANKNDLGGNDYLDVMAGLDWALANEPVDAKRVGLYGYSYGGEMAGFVEGKTTRFAAIVSGAPVIDQYSEYGTESGSWYDRWFYGLPWEHAQDAWRQSPLSYAGHARTPFLLLQGQADTTDPLGQSEEM
ncbi:MAG: S9 family peptidase, partial [Terriglobales bacterium]